MKSNKCVVIGLQSTGEARTLEALDDAGGELTDFVSTAKFVHISLRIGPLFGSKSRLSMLWRTFCARCRYYSIIVGACLCQVVKFLKSLRIFHYLLDDLDLVNK